MLTARLARHVAIGCVVVEVTLACKQAAAPPDVVVAGAKFVDATTGTVLGEVPGVPERAFATPLVVSQGSGGQFVEVVADGDGTTQHRTDFR